MLKPIETDIFSEKSVFKSTPQFIWSAAVEQETAPLLNEAMVYRNNNTRGSELFWNALKKCTQTLIIDKFLDIYILERMHNEITTLEKTKNKFTIKILYSRSKKKEDKDKLIGLITDIAKQKNGTVEFKYIHPCKWIVHDRFAFIDGILWHFGADIGGGHKDINAFSLGWVNTNFEHFFNSLWKEASL